MRFLIGWLVAGALFPAGAWAQAAQPVGVGRTPSGIAYQLFRRDATGQYAPRPLHPAGDSAAATRAGRYLLAHLTYLTGRDSVLQNTRIMYHNRPVPLPLTGEGRPGQPDEAFALLLPGDSAVFRFSADSLLRPSNQPVPGFLQRSGNVLVVQVAATQLINRAAEQVVERALQQEALAQQRQQLSAYTGAQSAHDDAAIRAYLQKNKLAPAQKTPGGVWYVLARRGTGPRPQPGQRVSVLYRGTLLATGKVFDSSAQQGGRPLTFSLGRGQVIPGWDEGIAQLPKGSKAILLIPSALAYAQQGSPPLIPPRAILRFDVEVVGIK